MNAVYEHAQLTERVRFYKRRVREERKALRQAADALAQFELNCRRLGIKFIPKAQKETSWPNDRSDLPPKTSLPKLSK